MARLAVMPGVILERAKEKVKGVDAAQVGIWCTERGARGPLRLFCLMSENKRYAAVEKEPRTAILVLLARLTNSGCN